MYEHLFHINNIIINKFKTRNFFLKNYRLGKIFIAFFFKYFQAKTITF